MQQWTMTPHGVQYAHSNTHIAVVIERDGVVLVHILDRESLQFADYSVFVSDRNVAFSGGATITNHPLGDARAWALDWLREHTPVG